MYNLYNMNFFLISLFRILLESLEVIGYIFVIISSLNDLIFRNSLS